MKEMNIRRSEILPFDDSVEWWMKVADLILNVGLGGKSYFFVNSTNIDC